MAVFLNLATSGPLEGRYVFFRSRHLIPNYFKKCSSVLGSSYITPISDELLICDKLSPEALINPKGTYDLNVDLKGLQNPLPHTQENSSC